MGHIAVAGVNNDKSSERPGLTIKSSGLYHHLWGATGPGLLNTFRRSSQSTKFYK